jgi:hypothetical protein
MEGKNWLWMGLGCAAVVVVCGLACSGIMLLGPTLFAAPEEVDVVVDAPLRVDQGQDFSIRIEVTNRGGTPQSIKSVEVTDSYGDGIAITSADPLWDTSEHDGINKLQWYDYSIEVGAHETEVIVLYANALYEGDWGGDVHVCINTKMNYASYPIRTLVGIPGAVEGSGGLGMIGETATPTPVEATWE